MFYTTKIPLQGLIAYIVALAPCKPTLPPLKGIEKKKIEPKAASQNVIMSDPEITI